MLVGSEDNGAGNWGDCEAGWRRSGKPAGGYSRSWERQKLGSNKARGGLSNFIFFSSRRQHTRYWRDWSSDVCSSDLPSEVLGRPASPFVADFVGADRGLKRLAVTVVEPGDLEQPPVVHVTDGLADARSAMQRAGARWAVVLDDDGGLHGWLSAERADGAGTVASSARRMDAWVPAGTTLKTAFSTMLQHEAGWVAVLDGDRFLGVLTPESLHAALRRSVDGAVPETAGSALG